LLQFNFIPDSWSNIDVRYTHTHTLNKKKQQLKRHFKKTAVPMPPQLGLLVFFIKAEISNNVLDNSLRQP